MFKYRNKPQPNSHVSIRLLALKKTTDCETAILPVIHSMLFQVVQEIPQNPMSE